MKKQEKIIFCPMCKSTNVSFDAKLEATYHVCKSCGYQSTPGVEFPHKIINSNKLRNKK